MAAPVRQAPFLLDERNGRVFPFDPILAKHRAMKPHYKAPVAVKPADPRMYHEPALPVQQPPVAVEPTYVNELVVEEPVAPQPLIAPTAPVAAPKADGRSKAARAARAAKAEAPVLTPPAPTDMGGLDDILGDLGE
jgi:hypothetical protein